MEGIVELSIHSPSELPTEKQNRKPEASTSRKQSSRKEDKLAKLAKLDKQSKRNKDKIDAEPKEKKPCSKFSKKRRGQETTNEGWTWPATSTCSSITTSPNSTGSSALAFIMVGDELGNITFSLT